MIRPWYRSHLFWLGIPGLCFLMWAWGKSNVERVGVALQPGWLWSSQGKLFWYEADPGNWVIKVDHREGTLSVRPQEENVIVCGVAISRGFINKRTVMNVDRRWFPPPRWEVTQLDASSSYRLISLPYWLATGGYAGVWMVALTGWQRRKARLQRVVVEGVR